VYLLIMLLFISHVDLYISEAAHGAVVDISPYAVVDIIFDCFWCGGLLELHALLLEQPVPV
jgi:hypothetical protein